MLANEATDFIVQAIVESDQLLNEGRRAVAWHGSLLVGFFVILAMAFPFT